VRLRSTIRDLEEGYLLVEPDSLAFNFDSDLTSDLLTLAEAATQSNRVAPLSAAPDLYPGPFLEGFSLPDAPGFDDWLTLQRNHWQRQWSLVLDQRSQGQSEAGSLKAALATAQRWVAHDPLDEASHRRLMQMHFALGDKTSALRAYEACRIILAKELELTPAPETAALAETIRRETAAHPEPQRQRIQSSDPPFVGRAESTPN
jgi:DNA-binding SARP family transcriptional activator